MLQIILTSLLLGVGLAMDACAVSMANGLNEPHMKVGKVLLISALFGIFQGVMPLMGYFVGAATLSKIQWIIPWIALILLAFIGGKMLYDGIKKPEELVEKKNLDCKAILMQCIATSIDALSVGFTIANYTLIEAFICILIVAIVTFTICVCAVYIGKKFGNHLGSKAEIIGGVILILIGLEIFIQGIFF